MVKRKLHTGLFCLCLLPVLVCAQLSSPLRERGCITHPAVQLSSYDPGTTHVISDSLDSVSVLPVVIHVIHFGEEIGEDDNISEDRILTQMEVLKEDFRRLPGTFGFNDHPDGADTEIEFCLAGLGQEGLPLSEPGVNRVNAQELGWKSPPYEGAYIDSVIKPKTIWNPYKYINIWVLDLAELRGLAQFPDSAKLLMLPEENGADSTDGIVVDVEEWGKFADNSGRTVTHELGHFLGLIHTWGNSSDCSIDDGCEDTPNSNRVTTFCDVGKMTCGSLDMIENYMDLTDGSCQNIFTQCQKLRMKTVLSRSPRRNSLLYSPVCNVPTAAPQASFTFSFLQTGACSNQFQFHDQSSNEPFTWKWNFGNGLTSSLPDPLITYDQPGVYQVTLEVENFQGKSTFAQEIVVCLIDDNKDDIASGIANIYPNPTSEILTLIASFKTPANLLIQLKDLTGRTLANIYEGTVGTGNFELLWRIPGNISSGLYLVSWKINDQQNVQKVLINSQ